MNKQQAFDKMVNNLKSLKERSINVEGKCLYLADDGTQCNVGCLLDPATARKFNDYVSLRNVIQDVPILQSLGHEFLHIMQIIHDAGHNWGPEGFTGWNQVLRVAASFDLDPSQVPS